MDDIRKGKRLNEPVGVNFVIFETIQYKSKQWL